MKNFFSGIALSASLLGITGCEKNNSTLNYENMLYHTIQTDIDTKELVTMLSSGIELENLSQKQQKDLLLVLNYQGNDISQIQHYIIQHTLKDDEFVQMLYNNALAGSTIAKSMLYHIIGKCILRSGFATMYSDQSNMTIVPIDSVKTIEIDQSLFRSYFGNEDIYDDIVTFYVHEPHAMNEASTNGDDIIINTATIGMSTDFNRSIYPTTPQQYLNAVKNNEITHALLYRKYGILSEQNDIILGNLNNKPYTIKQACEFLSDAMAIQTDITYFSTPLHLSFTNKITGSNNYNTYELSQNIVQDIANNLYTDMPEVQNKLNTIVESGIIAYQQATTYQQQIEVQMQYGVQYLQLFYKYLTVEKKKTIHKALHHHTQYIIGQFEEVKNEIYNG